MNYHSPPKQKVGPPSSLLPRPSSLVPPPSSLLPPPSSLLPPPSSTSSNLALLQTEAAAKVPDMDPAMKRALAEFKGQLAKVVVNNLSKYNKVDCKEGRIMDSNDFKYIARKVQNI